MDARRARRRRPPRPVDRESRPAPDRRLADLTQALESQLDLKEIPGDTSMRVYENVAWAPARAALPAAAGALDATRSSRPELAGATELSGSTPVLKSSTGAQSFSGPLTA